MAEICTPPIHDVFKIVMNLIDWLGYIVAWIMGLLGVESGMFVTKAILIIQIVLIDSNLYSPKFVAALDLSALVQKILGAERSFLTLLELYVAPCQWNLHSNKVKSKLK